MPISYCPEQKTVIYSPPDRETLHRKTEALLLQFEKYLSAHNLSISDVCIQRALIPQIISRVDKREGYFSIFHDKTRINELKQAALVAYWILKFKPFMVVKTPQLSVTHRRINEAFAAFYILSALKQYSVEIGRPMSHLVSKRLRDELLYAFMYWDLSKESVILITETLGETLYGVEAQGIESEDVKLWI